MAQNMNNNANMSYDSEVPSGKCVEETKQLNAGAREPEAYIKGGNLLKRDVTKHKPFGKLGGKGHC